MSLKKMYFEFILLINFFIHIYRERDMFTKNCSLLNCKKKNDFSYLC